MPADLYSRIIQELASVHYSRVISYSRYNEPLADRIILARIAEAREALPNAMLHTNTNGDYLTRKYLEELGDAGLNSLNIQVYLGNDDRYDHDKIRHKMERMLGQLDLKYEIAIDRPNDWLEARLQFRDMTIRAYGRNFDENGADRGGLVHVSKAGVRSSPCLSPFWHLYIDYNGKVVPCCNIRSDAIAHAPYVVGDLSSGASIFEVYANSSLVLWRRNLVGYGEKSGVCRTCLFVTYPATPENVARQQHLAEVALRQSP